MNDSYQLFFEMTLSWMQLECHKTLLQSILWFNNAFAKSLRNHCWCQAMSDIIVFVMWIHMKKLSTYTMMMSRIYSSARTYWWKREQSFWMDGNCLLFMQSHKWFWWMIKDLCYVDLTMASLNTVFWFHFIRVIYTQMVDPLQWLQVCQNKESPVNTVQQIHQHTEARTNCHFADDIFICLSPWWHNTHTIHTQTDRQTHTHTSSQFVALVPCMCPWYFQCF